MKQLGVILGMDWLSANHVYIGCTEKSIYMPTSNTTEGVALSELLKHTYQMVQFICARDKGFYVMLNVASESDVIPSDIPVVNEYLDVFPSDVTSLPPKREVEFSIDLIPGVEPVSIAPYRMSPVELKELKFLCIIVGCTRRFEILIWQSPRSVKVLCCKNWKFLVT